MTHMHKGTSSEKFQEILQKLVQDEMHKQKSPASTPSLSTLLVTLQNNLYSGASAASAFESTEQENKPPEHQEDEKERKVTMTVQQIKRYITSVLGRASCSSAEQREMQSSALSINKLFFDKATRKKVRIYDPILGDFEKEMSLQELLEDVVRTSDDPWTTLAHTAQHWARGQAALLKEVTDAEFEHIMRKLDNLDLDAHSSDEELDEEGKMAARRARRRFRTGKANLQRTEHAAAKRLRQQAEKQKADLNAMRTKASMLKKLTKDLRSSDPVAVSEAERQAAEIEATMKSLEKLIKQTQTKATMAAITAIQENDLDVYARSNGFDATDMRKSRGYANNGNAMRTGVAPNGAAVGSNDGATLNDGYRGDGRQIIAGVADGSEYLSGLGGGYDDDSRLGGGKGAGGAMTFNLQAAQSHGHLDLSDAATREEEQDDARGGRMRFTQQAAAPIHSQLDLSGGAHPETTSSSRDTRGGSWRSGPKLEGSDDTMRYDMSGNGPASIDEGTAGTRAGPRMDGRRRGGGHQMPLDSIHSLPNVHDPYDSGETRHKHESATYGHHKTNRVKARNAMNTETSEAGTYHAPYEEHHEEFHGEEWKYGGQGARWQANPSLSQEHSSSGYGKDPHHAAYGRWQSGNAPDPRYNARGIDAGGVEEVRCFFMLVPPFGADTKIDLISSSG
ncbi:hypothetical protein CYMTET_16180 [Cymbomonas tetramitiformis]|uniref:Uncharacterized protein n=1 Tax=Cymbomonas tetramitiformis TaxID=36881 RepID=A0AAE0GE03_9CHLO|nr:hypothetical protein CYMTET_16180 [Cymbomonas tetramitiformis]